MKFWKGNKIDAEFELEPPAVASLFVGWRHQQPGYYRNGMPLERQLRDWMTRSDGFDASWEDESDAGFGAIFNEAYDLIYGAAVASGKH